MDKNTNSNDNRILLRVTRAAELMDISPSKLYQLINEKIVPSIRVGSTIRIPVDELKKWIHDQAGAT